MTRLITRIPMLGFAMLILAAAMAPSMPARADSRSGEEIQFLISSVQSLKDAKFVRNGASYDPGSAADHLRLKLKNAGSRVNTAEDFIRLCATKSSASGQAYEIRFADGSVIATDKFLLERLAQYRKEHVPGG